MCEACESEDGARAPGIDLALVPAARALEAAMPGERAAAEAWAIFEGRASGGISWADYQRILDSYEAAERAAAGAPSLGRKRRQARFRCEDARAG